MSVSVFCFESSWPWAERDEGEIQDSLIKGG